MKPPHDPVQRFRERLFADWLPTFCNDPRRGYGTAGFREHSIRVGPYDADNFLRAMDGGLVQDTGGGQYRCAQSKALEQLFWQLEKSKTPRPVVLWLEPVIGIATLARLHYDLGWPEDRLGMQTGDWAFDLAAYASKDTSRQVIACEVKKSRSEIDHLLADLQHHSRELPHSPISEKPRHKNSFKKWAALRRERPDLLWLVGPEGYEHVFELSHGAHSSELAPVPVDSLRFAYRG